MDINIEGLLDSLRQQYYREVPPSNQQPIALEAMIKSLGLQGNHIGQLIEEYANQDIPDVQDVTSLEEAKEEFKKMINNLFLDLILRVLSLNILSNSVGVYYASGMITEQECEEEMKTSLPAVIEAVRNHFDLD
jgi:hypothetical protein